MAPKRPADRVEQIFSDLVGAGGSAARVRKVLEERSPDELTLLALLRLPVPVATLEYLALTPPFSSRPRILGLIAQNPKTPRILALRLIPSLYWKDLAEVARSPRVHGGVRVRAEATLVDLLPDLRLGERTTVARLATPPVLRQLLLDPEPLVLDAALLNPRLVEEDLLQAVRREDAPVPLLGAAGASSRWRRNYVVRLALVLQPRTPRGVSLAQLSSLMTADLLRVSVSKGVPPLIQAAALRVAGAGMREPPG